jgi:hypothetical protein
MIRVLTLAVALTLAAPAAAQTATAPPATPEQTARAAHALSFLWRPLPALRAEAVNAACGGAQEEIDAVEAALPPVLTPTSLARVRTLHGLLIIPTDDPASPYFFPDASLTWFTSGLGAVAVASEAEGYIAIQDAAGRTLAVQLGTAGGKPILRLRDPQGTILNFVGCAPTFPAP